MSDTGPYLPEGAGDMLPRDEAMAALLKSAAAGGRARLSWAQIAEEAKGRRRRRSAWQLLAAALTLVVAVGLGAELYRAFLPGPTLLITDETLPGDAEPPGPGGQSDIRQVEGGALPAGVERAVGTAGDHLWVIAGGSTFLNYGPSSRGWGASYRAEASSDARVAAYAPADLQAGGSVVVWTGLDALPGTERDFALPGDLLLTGFSLSPSGRQLILMGAAPPEAQGIDALTRHLFLVDTTAGSRRELPWVFEGSYGPDRIVWASDEESLYLTAVHTGGADAERVYRLDLATGRGERIPDLAQALAAGPDDVITGLARAEVELSPGMPEIYSYYNGTPGVWSVIDSDGNREPLLRAGEGSVDPGLPERALPTQAVFSADGSLLAAAYLRPDFGLTFVIHTRVQDSWIPSSFYVGAGRDEWGIGGRVLGWDPAGSAAWFSNEIVEGAGTETEPPGQYLVRLPVHSESQGAISPGRQSVLLGSALPGPVLAISVAGSPPDPEPTNETSPSTTQTKTTHASAAQILDTLLGHIRALRTRGDIFLPDIGLSPHEQPSFPTGAEGARTGYRINYEVEVGADRWVTLGVDHQELAGVFLDLKAEDRLSPTGLSFEDSEWSEGATPEGKVLLGVEIAATEAADPYILTIRVSPIDRMRGLEVAETMKRFGNP